ncbi:MAG TPA: hypothetical protein VMU42_12145 [Candidatus Sulfotelmatobacter sp.]|nr:hypothetical protein [Candidatus Sulfotelmatobacter sp.]
MHACAAAGAGFLIAVLWFDLMFDIQVRPHAGDVLPSAVLASIGAYYRRVTTEARPMNRLIAAVMLLTLAVLAGEIAQGQSPRWIGWLSFPLALSAIGQAIGRIVPNAIRLGRAGDSATVQSRLARAIYREHVYCLAAMALVAALQLLAPEMN